MTFTKFDRKAIWLLLAALLAIPYVICAGAAWLRERILDLGESAYKWSHPEQFKTRSKR